MTDDGKNEQTMKRYLLREMSPQEHSEFEDRYLADPDLFEQLAAFEESLIRSYLRGECSQQEKAGLEKRVAASPDWREKVEFERSLMQHLASLPAPGLSQASSDVSENASARSSQGKIAVPREILRPWGGPLLPALRFAAVIIGLVLIAGGAWLVMTNLQLHQQLAQIEAQRADLERHQLELQQQLAALTLRLPPAIQPFVLTSHLVRDPAQQKPLNIPLDVSSIPLQLVLDQDGFPSYIATLETAGGARLWQKSNLKSQPGQEGQHIIAIELPADVFSRGTYILKLAGISRNHKPDEVAVYIFRVVKH
jgi:hypothetical protein